MGTVPAWTRRSVMKEPKLPDFTMKRRRRRVRPTAAVAPVVALLLVAAGVLLWQRALRDSGTGGLQSPAVAYVVRDGDAVTGTAYLIESGSGKVQLCLGGSRLMGPPSCSVVAVPVSAVRWEEVPGAQRVAGRWYAEHVTVRGTWTGATVVAESVSAGPPDTGATNIPNPCAQDEGNGTGLGTLQDEAALAALGGEVFGHPDRYAGLWRALSADGLGRTVVNLAGDPSGVEAKLRGLYPFPFCLARVTLSQADLEKTLSTIGNSTAQWLAAIDSPRDRVIVSVAVLTEDLRRRLTPYADQVLVSQLLKPA